MLGNVQEVDTVSLWETKMADIKVKGCVICSTTVIDSRGYPVMIMFILTCQFSPWPKNDNSYHTVR